MNTKSHTIGSTQPVLVLEAFLDYCCPFSAKLFNVLFLQVVPYLEINRKMDKVKIIFRNQVQPWHPQSTMMHEVALAVARQKPSQFFPFSTILFQKQGQFFDQPTFEKSRMQLYEELTDLLPLLNDADLSKEKIMPFLIYTHPINMNAGNAIGVDLKYHLKISRHNHIHVSPTVLVNGLINDDISSAWTFEQWIIFVNLLIDKIS